MIQKIYGRNGGFGKYLKFKYGVKKVQLWFSEKGIDNYKKQRWDYLK